MVGYETYLWKTPNQYLMLKSQFQSHALANQCGISIREMHADTFCSRKLKNVIYLDVLAYSFRNTKYIDYVIN